MPTTERFPDLTEEHLSLLVEKVIEINETYDFTNMNEDEIRAVLDLFKTIVDGYLTEQGTELPIMERPFVDPHHDEESKRTFDDRRPFDRDCR
jgi:hypothetical protein